MPVLIGGFGADRLRNADACSTKIRGLNTAAEEHSANRIRALLAEQKVGAFDSSRVRVPDHIHGYRFSHVAGLRQKIAETLFESRYFFFLT